MQELLSSVLQPPGTCSFKLAAHFHHPNWVRPEIALLPTGGGGVQVQGVNAAKFNMPSSDLLVADQEFLVTFAKDTPAVEVDRVAR